MAARQVGKAVRRNEDETLLRGQGVYLDDVELPGALHVAFLRSPLAHARIVRLDVSGALDLDGVVAVYTHADLGELGRPLPLLFPTPAIVDARTQRPLASDEVAHVGQTIAMVVAVSRYVAEDALELIDLELEALPPTVDLEASALPGAPPAHTGLASNVAATLTQVTGDPDAAFAAAERTFSARLVLDRGAAMPMETRGVAARFDARSGELTVWDTTQAAIPIRGGLVSALGLAEDKVRVIVPETGGGFGVKAFFFYPEEILVPWAAMRLGRTVKWVEDRFEHFVGSNHERKQVHHVEVAYTHDGVVTAIRDRFLHDSGAFIAYGLTTPLVTASQIAGPYRVPNQHVEFSCVYTNTVSVSPYRGAGRPHACFVMERILDRVAADVGIDRVEVRRRNFIEPPDFPYGRPGIIFADGLDVELDSGDYPRQLDMLLAAVGWDGFAAERAAARVEGRVLGIGLACYVEATGMGPYEGAHVQIEGTSGRIRVATGLTGQGQGHRTTFAQIAADRLGVETADVLVVEGDTGEFPWGVGTYGSRAAVVSGNAVALAADAVREKAIELAAGMLEAAPGDLELAGGSVIVRGSPGRSIPLKLVAMAANPVRYAFDPEVALLAGFGPPRDPAGPLLPSDDGPGLEATRYFSPPRVGWASGAHAAVIEVDIETGQVRYLRYAAIHDCGTVVNPMIVDGQVMGGIVQGIGGAFYERIVYDADGQLRNASFADYLIPTAYEVPPLTIGHLETPSPHNPLGIKGAGESGVIPGAALLASALDDALVATGLRIVEMPLDPSALRGLLRAARPVGGGA